MATFMWCHVGHYASTLLSEASPRAIVLPSPYIGPFQFSDNFGDFVRCLTAAASTVLDSEEIAQALVDTLLQIASNTREASCIPTDLWSWLTKRPSLLPISQGRNYATARHDIEVVRALVDIEVLKSYLFVVWSEWDWLSNSCFDEMCIVIREDFGGIEMRHYRADLIQRLDDVLGQLDRIAARQSDYFTAFEGSTYRSAHDTTDAFAAQQDDTEVEGGYKEAMRFQRLEKEEARVRKFIEKEKKDREDGGDKMDLDRTPPRAELDEVEKILVEAAAPKRSRWDQTPRQIPSDVPMVPIIMNAPGFMQDDKHNRYLTDEELDALLPTSGYVIVAPPPGYAPAPAPRKLQATPVATI